MSADQRARSAARVAAIVAIPAVTGTAVVSKWAGGKLIALFAAFGLVGAAIGIGLFLATGSNGKIEDTPRVTSTDTATVTATATATATVTVTATAAVSVAASVAASGTAKPSAIASGDTLVAETALLEKARTAMGSDPTTAFAVCEEHRKAYPAGQLAAERDVMAVDALKRLGRNGEAKARGEVFIARNPKSFYVERVRKLIEGL